MIVPWGFRKMLNWAWERYGLPIYVTENGISVPNENTLCLEDALNDTFRVRYYEGYLNAMLDAVTLDGVEILGYMAWSLLEYVLTLIVLTEVISNGRRGIILVLELRMSITSMSRRDIPRLLRSSSRSGLRSILPLLL
jgi:hypothetical protein